MIPAMQIQRRCWVRDGHCEYRRGCSLPMQGGDVAACQRDALSVQTQNVKGKSVAPFASSSSVTNSYAEVEKQPSSSNSKSKLALLSEVQYHALQE
eukprot:scaffold8983_cov72-Skeletonema_dohrnii-CCMP3373.AAC.2